jgi:hypothetical protein
MLVWDEQKMQVRRPRGGLPIFGARSTREQHRNDEHHGGGNDELAPSQPDNGGRAITESLQVGERSCRSRSMRCPSEHTRHRPSSRTKSRTNSAGTSHQSTRCDRRVDARELETFLASVSSRASRSRPPSPPPAQIPGRYPSAGKTELLTPRFTDCWMTAAGLSVSFTDMRRIGWRPLARNQFQTYRAAVDRVDFAALG